MPCCSGGKVASPRHCLSASRAALWSASQPGGSRPPLFLGLPMVDGNVRVSLEFLFRCTVGFTDAVWILTRGVQVVKVSKEVFSCFESFIGCHKSGVLVKAGQKGHERIPLLAALTLLNVVNLTNLVLPQENRRLAAESARTATNAPPLGRLIRPRSMAFLDTRSKTLTPTTDTMVHLGLDCVSVCRMCETHSHPDLVFNAYWNGAVASSTSFDTCCHGPCHCTPQEVTHNNAADSTIRLLQRRDPAQPNSRFDAIWHLSTNEIAQLRDVAIVL